MSSLVYHVINLENGIRNVRKALKRAYDALVAGDQGATRVLLVEVDQVALDTLSLSVCDQEDMVGLDGSPLEPTHCKRLKARKASYGSKQLQNTSS
jgi:hypothetical protein